MSWQGVLGHDEVAEQFQRAPVRGRLASTFLFLGRRSSVSGRSRLRWRWHYCARPGRRSCCKRAELARPAYR